MMLACLSPVTNEGYLILNKLKRKPNTRTRNNKDKSKELDKHLFENQYNLS